MSLKGGSPLIVARHIVTRRHVLTLCAIWILVALFFSSSHSVSQKIMHPTLMNDGVSESIVTMAYQARGDFYPYKIRGFDNTGVDPRVHPESFTCASISRGAEIGVQKSWHLVDDLWKIAGELDKHGMVQYSQLSLGSDKASFDLKGVVERSWDRLATSCVLLPEHDVYLCITRVIFHGGEDLDHPRISFLRGQIFSRNWLHLDDYQLRWRNDVISFPRVFDIPTDWVHGGHWYGPEDARIIIEHGVEGAEPVIVFNMVSKGTEWKRSMWIFRPFSKHTTILTIKGAERPTREKNWTPLFVSTSDSAQTSETPRPNDYIHFVHAFTPIKVLKCSLLDGMCDWVFVQNVDPEVSGPPLDEYPALRGGTQFVPVPLGLLAGRQNEASKFQYEGLQAYVAMPRTHVEKTKYCKAAVYRPELIVLVTDGTRFMITYGTEPLDFGEGNLADLDALREPCGNGRIIIANSIASWDYNANVNGRNQDVMTIQASVNDATVQSFHVTGFLSVVAGLSSTQRLLAEPSSFFNFNTNTTLDSSQVDESFEANSNMGFKVKACLEDKAYQYVSDWTFTPEKLKDDADVKAEKDALNSDIEKFGLDEARRMHGIKAQEA